MRADAVASAALWTRPLRLLPPTQLWRRRALTSRRRSGGAAWRRLGTYAAQGRRMLSANKQTADDWVWESHDASCVHMAAQTSESRYTAAAQPTTPKTAHKRKPLLQRWQYSPALHDRLMCAATAVASCREGFRTRRFGVGCGRGWSGRYYGDTGVLSGRPVQAGLLPRNARIRRAKLAPRASLVVCCESESISAAKEPSGPAEERS